MNFLWSSMKAWVLVLGIVLSASTNTLASDEGIFALTSKWTNQDGKSFELKELFDGRVAIVSMVFLGCDYTCPVTIKDMKAIDRELQKVDSKANQHVNVLISIDPERDTPKEMKKYMKEHELDPSLWIIASSKPEHVRELAAVLGFSYRRDRAMEFAHSMLTWVFQRDGRVSLTREGAKPPVGEVARHVRDLLKQKVQGP